jgi:drug/metabolite transporter (DMT)-like permease
MTPQERALPALICGAILIGLAPIFVRLADVGPSAVAFWRLFLALPVLLPWWWRARRLAASAAVAHSPRREPERSSWRQTWPWGLMLGGVFFAGDLAVWHQSLHWTSVANATLLTNLAPVWVTLVAWRFLGERIGGGFVLGLLLTLCGAVVLMADSLQVSAQTVWGDLLAVLTSLFYAGYLLVISRNRARYSTVAVMFWTSATAALVVLPLAWLAPQPFWPQSAQGWGIVAGLALLSHVCGQGLIAYGFAHLPASFSAVSLLLQPLAAALFAWVLLAEAFGAQQALGGAIVLAGILLCRRMMARDR